MNVWIGWLGAAVAIVIAYLYAISRSGLALRATRDESVAASASGIDIVRERLIAFVVSAFIIGIAGALYAHFLSIVNPGAFYLRTTFITLSMLVVGGMYSLSGAVTGVVTISVLIELFRNLEKGISIGAIKVALPNVSCNGSSVLNSSTPPGITLLRVPGSRLFPCARCER